ncbi:MAG: response regulator [Candidatus Scalindua sp.]|jgi:PAS domain S-box-containing protein|nr:response regulator [Candidatus Scalindua sp.]
MVENVKDDASLKNEINISCNVIVVEDNEGLSRLIEISLKEAGLNVALANNGKQAIDWVVNNQIDIMLLDYKLPDMSARQIVESLRERQFEIPFIIMTGHGDEKLAVEMMKAGARDYMVKDGNFMDLLPLIVKRILKQVDDERKLVEAEKRLLKLSHAIEQSPVIVEITDADANIEYVNPKFTQLTGYTREEAIGSNPRIMQSGKTPPEIYKELWDTISSGSEWKGEFCNKKKNGELYWEHASISPVVNSDGIITDYIAVKEDITKRKKIEKSLIQSEKLNAMGVMAAGIAHDFNNVLAIISGHAQLMEIGCNGNEGIINGLRTICRAVKDGSETVRRMSEFTRMEKSTSKFVSVYMVDVVKEAIDFTMPKWKDLAHASGKTYTFDIEGLIAVPAVLGSPSELREITINIINNAIDAMPGGGCVSFRTWEEGNSVYISISDNGIGMKEEVQAKIFDLFYTTKGMEGSGLGMSVAYGIIGKHGGKIGLESRIGEGSVFTIELPVATETVREEVSSESSVGIKAQNYRILVVDDVKEISEILYTLLSRQGYNVDNVESGAEAIKMLEKESYNLVICDLGMPDVTGWDVIKFVKSLEKETKIGLITGWADILDSLKNNDLGVDFVISKPINFERLSNLVMETLLKESQETVE